MVLLMLCLHLNSFAQHISMQLKNVTVKQAIETIQKQNGYSFTFAASDLNTQKIITVTARNLPIEKVVEQILIGQNVSYTVQGKDIIIKKKSNQATQQKKKSTISGIITDNYGEPIIGANIKEKNGTNGTISDIDGKFQLTVDEGSSVQISYLGYLTQEVNTRNKTHLAISMKEDAQADACFSFFSPFGSNDNHTVSGPCTVNSGRAGVFQNLYRLNVIRIDRFENIIGLPRFVTIARTKRRTGRNGKTVNDDKRIVPGANRGCSTYIETTAAAYLCTRLHYLQTCCFSG